MRTIVFLALAGSTLLVPPDAIAQTTALPRLSSELLDVLPPSDRVSGAPGSMTVRNRECRVLPMEGVRRRIVDIAVQEWAFFGFPVMDQVDRMRLLPPGSGGASSAPRLEAYRGSGRPPPPSASEAGRVAAAIAGYWSITPEGPGIVSEQNRAWNGSRGVAARWNSPWSAAFISWVMCEAGLGSTEQFRRAIAHWSYIDQAIRARDGSAAGASFVAYDAGEAAVEPGDLLCTSRQPAYRTLAERRRQMGSGARSHCDVVVKVDAAAERVYVIGGNVLRSVSLKVLPATRGPDGMLLPLSGTQRPLFAHLKLQGGTIEANALDRSPVIRSPLCPGPGAPATSLPMVAPRIGLDTEPARRC